MSKSRPKKMRKRAIRLKNQGRLKGSVSDFVAANAAKGKEVKRG